MNLSGFAFKLGILSLAGSFALSGLAGCSHIKQTQFETIGVGGPVWVKRTVRTDEKTLFGSRMVDYEVGFLYCQVAENRGPVCVPVEVSDIPRGLTHQGIEFLNGPAQISIHRKVITYQSLQADDDQEPTPPETNSVADERQIRSNAPEQRDMEASSTPQQFEVIYNVEGGWGDKELKLRLSSYIGKPIVLVSRTGKVFRGTLIEARLGQEGPGPRIVISTNGTQSFLPLKAIKFIGK
ncbi:MAG TPA: hypothetical protein PKH54_12360 [Myxococcota bacterium]|nr:hypothetical protein [Myxococcota bacterium]HOD00731.1 hypothetical protein [Myxococcota bacterium]HPV04709.1 hypothetical protein [Myxococcota bacterium]